MHVDLYLVSPWCGLVVTTKHEDIKPSSGDEDRGRSILVIKHALKSFCDISESFYLNWLVTCGAPSLSLYPFIVMR